MKKIIRFALILLVGAILGYVFHNKIDSKLKEKFGNERVESAKATTEKLAESTYEKGKNAVNSIKDTLSKEDD